MKYTYISEDEPKSLGEQRDFTIRTKFQPLMPNILETLSNTNKDSIGMLKILNFTDL